MNPLKFCPLSCILKSKPKQISSETEVSSEPWEFLDPVVFCAEVFPQKCNHEKAAAHSSNVCWYCDTADPMKGKFVAKKSRDTVPENVRRVQEMLGFRHGEPLTRHNLPNIIPSVGRKRRAENTDNMKQAKASPLHRTVPPNVPSSQKENYEKFTFPPLKKFAPNRLYNNHSVSV